MRRNGARAFTLIELLVVIAIIVILATIMVPVISGMYRTADAVRCANRLRQMGTWLIGEAVKPKAGALHGYPLGGSSPGMWVNPESGVSAYSHLISSLSGKTELGQCPADKAGAPTSPSWATCSYAYVGSLSPMFECQCSDCKDAKRKVWSLYWSGVNYTGGHKRTEGGSSTDFDDFKDYDLADNLVFNEESIDDKDSGTEATKPTIPEHQDTDKFHAKDKPKFRTQRALREIPETPEDHRGDLPLLMDIAVIKAVSNPPTGAPDWQRAHRYITALNKNTNLYANHCATSAVKKQDWGVNIFYTNGSVRWKPWKDLRFQVMASGEGGKDDNDNDINHYYFW